MQNDKSGGRIRIAGRKPHWWAGAQTVSGSRTIQAVVACVLVLGGCSGVAQYRMYDGAIKPADQVAVLEVEMKGGEFLPVVCKIDNSPEHGGRLHGL